MKKSPIFSVIIPTFNRADCISTAINSVFQQTHQSFEIIIVNDGSTDETEAIVSTFQDDRIRYIHQENGGGSKARNTGLNNVTGKYIAFLDSDDTFLPHHLKSSIEFLQDKPNTVAYSQVIVDRGDGVTLIKPNRSIKPGEHISEYLMMNRGFVPTITLIIPAIIANSVRYDENLRMGQDFDFAIRLAAVGAKLAMLKEPGAIWNDEWSPNRLSGRSYPEERMNWLKNMRPYITNKAELADLGWPVAKAFSQKGMLLKGLKLYSKALLSGCYSPKVAISVFLQITFPKSLYRKFADLLSYIGIKP